MTKFQNINIQEENDFKKITDLVIKNYKLFIICLIISLGLAFIKNRYSTPYFNISSSILIKEESNQGGSNINDYLNSSLFGQNKNLQNELWIIKSNPVIEQTVRNLDLIVSYHSKGRFNYYEAYKTAPFKISYKANHPQPINIKMNINFLGENYFQVFAQSKKASFFNFETETFTHEKENWVFNKNGTIGELIETPDISFVVEPIDSSRTSFNIGSPTYIFDFSTINSLIGRIRNNLNFSIVDKLATVIKISLRTESTRKGIDIVNELMNVYSEQNLERKNHTANITISYIEKQLDEISDSLSQTEDNLQKFRSSRQLLNITDQASGVSAQYRDLQNQLAELVSRKRYYDDILELLKNDNFSDMMLPAAMGIQDQVLNSLMPELINAQAQRSNLIKNNQERNPLVPKLTIQIDNLKKTISENISALSRTTSISINEMNKRIRIIETEISRLPATQRQLGNIERKYRLNDAIYNYLLEKHAQAKITKASNLPDNIIVEQAMGTGQISPNPRKTYLMALFMGLALPFGIVLTRSLLNNKIIHQDDINKITDRPVLGKILHNRYKTKNVMFEFPKSNISESFRALRTNLDFYVRGGHSKVILVTSCLENEGKSFVTMNLAMSYAQLGRKTILVDFDMRKQKIFFSKGEESLEGLSSYLIDKSTLGNIINKSPHEKLDYIVSGILPPNPVELMALEKTEKLINALKREYDIVVLDTTPLAQVTDAYLLINLSEVRIIISRQGYTIKNVFSLVMKDLEQKKVDNVCVVLNDNRITQDQYGYGYGYYNKSPRKFFRKRKRIAEYYLPKNPQTPTSGKS